MEIHHHTHNISFSSSNSQCEKNINNNANSSASSYRDYTEKNKTKNDWSQLILLENTKRLSGIINEEDINISTNSHNEKNNDGMNQKGKKLNSRSKGKGKYKNIKLKSKKFGNYYLNKKLMVLNNGIVVKNLNKSKKVIKDNVERTPFILTNEKKFKNNIYSNNNLEKLLKINEEKKNDSFHIIYIKKPNRSFMTKICQYKNHKPKKDRLFKKLNSSSAINDKKNPKSCRLTPVSTISKPIKPKSKSITIIRKKIPSLIENYDNNKLDNISTTTYKKFTINSNASLYFSKSNNLLQKNNLKKRPLSSVNVVRKEININIKSSKIDSYNNTTHNKSYNMPKTRLISSLINSNENKELTHDSNNIIFGNKNFINQFKELKSAFETYGNDIKNVDKNNLKFQDYQENKDFKTYREESDNIIKRNFQGYKKITRKLNSAKVRSNSYLKFYPKEISPLYGYKNKFEDEKQNRPNYCSRCEYQKHFGNEKNCPICVTIKEQNQLREESLSNKKYYFPFKDKYEYESFNSQQNSNRKKLKIFKNLFNTKNENINIGTFNNFNYLNNAFTIPYYNRMIFSKGRKVMKKNRSNFIEKYDIIQKYLNN